MTAIERLNALLAYLKNLDDESVKLKPHTFIYSLSNFVEDLPDITQQLETAIIELEDEN